MRRKIYACAMVGVLSVFMLVGCGKKDSSDSKTPSSDSVQTSEADFASQDKTEEVSSYEKDKKMQAIENAMIEETHTRIETLHAKKAAVLDELGDTLESYFKNYTAPDAWYALAVSESTAYYDSITKSAIEYYKYLATIGDNMTRDQMNECINDFYSVLRFDCLEEFFNAWEADNDEIDDAWRALDNLNENYEEMDFDPFEHCYDEQDAHSNWAYEAFGTCNDETYEDYIDVLNGFGEGNFDVDAILAAQE